MQRAFLLLTLCLAASAAQAQRPYIGFVYPAGGQAGVTTRVRLGGQGLDGVNEAIVCGKGVSAKVAEYHRRLNNEEMSLLREQAVELKRASVSKNEASKKLLARIEERTGEFVPAPAAASLSNLVLVDVTIAPDAEPGRRELVLATPRGASNPLVFYVGQLPEVCRKPMLSATIQVLGKEESSLRKRPEDEKEQQVTVPCVANGQIASGEVNRYRFAARKGQRLLFSAQARQCVPFVADAVPGWFQPVMTLRDARGKEVAYDDDYRFQPDPVIFYEVPRDGEYLLDINDAIYRGREDFVYRLTMGELPFVTDVFPLGGRVGQPLKVKLRGWNLDGAEPLLPPLGAGPGIHSVAARSKGFVSNRLPFALDTLPECFEQEPNNDPQHAQAVKLPVIINGRIDRPDDWDVFKFWGRAGEKVVAEVMARRLDSPLDSVLKITDAGGKLLAFNDDHEDPEAGTNTHDADSYLMVELPADGTYYVHIGRHGPPWRRRVCLSPADQRPAARFRALRGSHQRRDPRQDQRPAHCAGGPQRRFRGSHQARLEGPAGRVLVVPRRAFRHADRCPADRENGPRRDEASRAACGGRPCGDRRQDGFPRGRARGRPDAGLSLAAPGAGQAVPARCLPTAPAARAADEGQVRHVAPVGDEAQGRGDGPVCRDSRFRQQAKVHEAASRLSPAADQASPRRGASDPAL